MIKFLYLLIIAIPFHSYAQPKPNCVYLDPNILIVNCGKEDRYKLSEATYKLASLKPKVIALDFIFFDKRPADSSFVRRLTGTTPIILSMGGTNDSSYFEIANCHNGPRSINGNELGKTEFLFPSLRHNDKLRDSFELLILKYFDAAKYSKIKQYLIAVDLAKLQAKAKIEFNGNSFSCFLTLNITDVERLNSDIVKDKIVILGYFGTDPDKPLDKDKDKYAHRVHATKDTKDNYMYDALISANIISNLIRKDIRDGDMGKIGK